MSPVKGILRQVRFIVEERRIFCGNHNSTHSQNRWKCEQLLVCIMGGGLVPMCVSTDSLSAELQPDMSISCDSCEDWNQPQDPFHIHGNTYYVGTAGLSALLIDSGDGLVLLDGGLPQSAPLIAASIAELGYSTDDIRLIALSHAHYDHAGGLNALQQVSGARVLIGRHATKALALGEPPESDPQYGMNPSSFPPVSSVEIVEDGASVTLGDIELHAIYTPGHTPGGTTWTWQSCENGNCVSVVYADSLSPVSREGFLFGNGAGAVLRTTASRIRDLDCDIFLSPHPFFFNMQTKLERQGQDNAFVSGEECRAYAESSLEWLERRLAAE